MTLRVTVVAVGRLRAGPARSIYDDYAGRCAWPVALREVTSAARLINACPAGSLRVALDETGMAMSSAQFAARLAGWRDAGRRDIAFLIGGADGLDAAIRESAELVLSLGPMTWPHLLVRGMLAEQLYRAQTILAGHPYHRDG